MTKKDFELLLRDGWRKDEGYVFVSYSSRDWEKVYPCVLELRARGINVFIDIEFQENSSSSWLRNLEERLIQNDECKGIVAFVSISYLGSYACLTELIANRTEMQRMEKGNPLPVFYIALDEALSTPQKMSQHIYSGAVKKQLRSYAVKMESEECTTLENYLLDCHLGRYPDRESIRHLLLKPIKTKFNVAAIMCDLIFSDTGMMPNIQLFEGGAECAKMLMRNFVNDKNESIELSVLEELQLETCARLGRPVEKDQLPELAKPKDPDDSEKPQMQDSQLKASAEEDDADVQFELGSRYYNGESVEQDWKWAVYWYYKAAEQGHVQAQFNLGVCYKNGEGVEQDWKQVVYWYRRAAEQGHVQAQNGLGVCYYNGTGAERNLSQAVYWFRKAAERGHVFAQFNLGVCYDNGTGIAQDWNQAACWYRKAAEQGHVQAQFNLGSCYENGEGIAQDWNQAVYWYRKAAEQGHVQAQFNLGSCYENGEGIAQDWNQAVYWYRKAAEQGHVQAQFNLGSCYENGESVERDWRQAVYWYRKAAEQGHVQAQFNLSVCYYNGTGVAQDWNQAACWYRKAAEQGHVQAQFNLGICYEKGQGVERNWSQAAYWYRKAAEQGHVFAQASLDKLLRR